MLTQKSQQDLARLISEEPTTNINNLMLRGQGIRIQDLVKKLNGSGMKVV